MRLVIAAALLASASAATAAPRALTCTVPVDGKKMALDLVIDPEARTVAETNRKMKLSGNFELEVNGQAAAWATENEGRHVNYVINLATLQFARILDDGTDTVDGRCVPSK